ncbi:MAG: surface layer protein [Ruminococcaceae bacterium]|nr:surface layer protein [Oscillospiraceae bacterium]
MKKRISCLLLMLCLLFPVRAMAAEEAAAPFTRTKTYDGRFADVAEGSAFYENVAALYEYGLTVGRTENRYAPKDSMTVGQTVIFAGRVRSLYENGDPEQGAAAFRAAGLPTAIPYLHYLQSEGVLGTELGSGSLGVPATRAQVAHILANLLPESFLPFINDGTVAQGYTRGTYITDVTAATPYEQDILKLYRCGILQGADETGSFFPDSHITRGAAAAMLTRMMDPALRITLDWDIPGTASAAGMTYGQLVPPGQAIPAPKTEVEMDLAVRHMFSRGENFMDLTYDGLTAESARTYMELALRVVRNYCEQGYNYVNCTYTYGGGMRLKFGTTAADDAEALRAAALARAIEVHDRLWAEGKLTAAMTQTEKARVYFDWICANTVYDYNADGDSVSHLPYGLFETGTAVCDGYTGAYNLLLRMEGIPCSAQGNETHLWTVATLDGVSCHIDVTWGDTGSEPDHTRFAMTAEESYRLHPW